VTAKANVKWEYECHGIESKSMADHPGTHAEATTSSDELLLVLPEEPPLFGFVVIVVWGGVRPQVGGGAAKTPEKIKERTVEIKSTSCIIFV